MTERTSKRPHTPRERAPTPRLGTDPIPKSRYTSAEFAQLEWERMWTRTWLLAGFASDIPEPGDYFTFEIGPESVLVIQAGMHSRAFAGLHLGDQELRIRHFHYTLDQYLC